MIGAISLLAEQLAATALGRLAIALAIGLLIGVEREWRHAEDGHRRAFAGARTFALTALAGGVSSLPELPLGIGIVALFFVGALASIAHFIGARETKARGGTTEITLLLVFMLGYVAVAGEPLIAAIVGIAVALLLNLKESITKATAALSATEMRSILQFLAIAVIVLPILPDEGYGPFDAINPRALWLLVILISGLSFSGYWLARAFGARNGVLLAGLVGGLASSTATTASLSRLGRRKPALAGDVAKGIVAANIVMLIRLGVLCAVLAPDLSFRLWTVLSAASLAALAVSMIQNGRRNRVSEVSLESGAGDSGEAVSGDGDLSAAQLQLTNPFELRPALIFAGALAGVTILAEYAASTFGDRGLFALAAVSGVVDVDAVAISAFRLGAADAVAGITALGVVCVAAGVNMASKLAMSVAMGGPAIARPVAMSFAAAIVVGAAVFWAFV